MTQRRMEGACLVRRSIVQLEQPESQEGLGAQPKAEHHKSLRKENYVRTAAVSQWMSSTSRSMALLFCALRWVG